MSLPALLFIAATSGATAAEQPQEKSKFPIVAEIDRIGAGSATTLSYDIGKNGRVTRCAVLVSSGSAFLDNGACDIFRSKAKFSPKRDAKGKTVEEIGRTTRIVWNIED